MGYEASDAWISRRLFLFGEKFVNVNVIVLLCNMEFTEEDLQLLRNAFEGIHIAFGYHNQRMVDIERVVNMIETKLSMPLTDYSDFRTK